MRQHPTDVGELVKYNQAKFLYYKDQELWYRITGPGEACCGDSDWLFDFPIPTKDLVGTMIESNVKALTVMKWVGKHLETLKEYERLAQEAKANVNT